MSKIQKKNIQDRKGKIHFTFKGIRLYGCLFLFYTLSCNTININEVDQKITSAKSLLRNGDIVVRDGKDEVSRAAKNFNKKDKIYSHCGIIQIENDTVFVYHALGGSYNPSRVIMRERLEKFFDPSEVNQFAIYRYPLNKKQSIDLTILTTSYYKAKLPFDMFFNFYTDDKMYCSEFVFKCLNQTFNNRLLKSLQEKEEVLYVSIDDLYLNEMAKLIVKHQF